MSKVVELAESAMARQAGRGEIFDLKVNYVSEAVGDEELTATSSVVHAGRRTIVTDCRIETSTGRLVATASATFAITREKE